MLLVPTALIWAVSYFNQIIMAVIKVFKCGYTNHELRAVYEKEDNECVITITSEENEINFVHLDSMDLLEFIFELQEIKKQIDK